MWVPDGPLRALCYLFADRRVFGGRVSGLGLYLARVLLLEFVNFTYPPAYRVGIVERNAGTLCQFDSSPGVAGGGHHPGLYAPVVLRSGEHFLHGLVVRGSLVVLALYRDTLAPAVHDDVDALIPCSPEQSCLMSHGPEEVGHEDLELGPAHETDLLETSGELHGGRGRRHVPHVPDHIRNGDYGTYQKEPGKQHLELLDQSYVFEPQVDQEHDEREDSSIVDSVRWTFS